MHNDYASVLLLMPIGKLRTIRKAVQVLMRAGMYREDAVRIIMEQYLSNGEKLYKVS